MSISKELLKAISVLDTVERVYERTSNTISIDTDSPPYSYMVNIYETAHQCKVWALTQNYWLDSGIQVKPKGWQANCGYLDLNSQIAKDFYANTEPAVIFKAAEWILQPEAGSDDTWEHFLQNYFNPSEPALTADQLL